MARSAYDNVMITDKQLQQTDDQAHSELEDLKRDRDHFKDTFELKDKEITSWKAT